MTNDNEEQIAYQHFKETLFNDLKENSKPVIMSLSMLADDYKKFSDSIARSISEFIRQVKPQLKLLGLYLLDSIVKNQKDSSDYVQVFQRHVVPLFVLVFESVDEPQRKSMFKLRQTWTSVFSASCLYDLDLKVKSIDPAWPIISNDQQQRQTTTVQQKESLSQSIVATTTVNNTLQQHHQQTRVGVSGGGVGANASRSDTLIKSHPPPSTNTTMSSRHSVDLTAALEQTTAAVNSQLGGGRGVSPIRDPRLANRPAKIAAETKKQDSVVNPVTMPSRPAVVTGNTKSAPTTTTTVIKKKLSGGLLVNTTTMTPKSASSSVNGGMKRASPTTSQPEQKTDSKKAKLEQQQQQIGGGGGKKTILLPSVSESPPLKQNRAILNKNSKSGRFESDTTTTMSASTSQEPPIEARTNSGHSQSPSPPPLSSSIQTTSKNKSDLSPPESKIKTKDNIENMKKQPSVSPPPSIQTTNITTVAAPSSSTNVTTAPVVVKQKKKTLLPSPPIELAIVKPPPPPSNKSSQGNGFIDPSDIDERFVGDVDERFVASQSSVDSSSAVDQMPVTTRPARRTLIQKPPDLSGGVGDPLLSVASMDQLPPIRPRYEDEEQTSSMLVLDGRSYRVQPDQTTTIKYFYTTCQVLCDTRSRDIFLDQKRVAKMGDPTKEVSLGGRKCRLMYMGRRCELWIDGMAFSFRADAPPKQISLRSQLNPSHIKRYYVTVDGRTMSVFFNNYKVCQIPSSENNVTDGGVATSAATQHVKLAPDEYEKHEVSFVCPPKRIMIDGVERRMRYDTPVPCIEMDHGRLHVIRFDGPPRAIHVDEAQYEVPMDKARRIKLNGRAHELAWGGPGYEVIVDGRPYEIQFNQPAREIMIGTRPHMVYIEGDAPEVKILGRLPAELLLNQQQQQAAQHKERQQQQHIDQSSSTSTNMLDQLSSLIPTDVNELIKKLTMKNMLPQFANTNTTRQETTPSVQQQQQQQSLANTRFRVPDLTSMEPELLKQKYDQAIVSLYSGNQCPQCGNRFNQLLQPNSDSTTSNQSRYAKHLDWHFRQNKKEKEEVNKVKYRSWFYPITDWILYEEISEEVELQQQHQHQQGGNNTNNLVDMGDQMLIDSSDLASSHGSSSTSSNGGESQGGATMSSSFGRQNSSFNAIKTCAASDDIGDTCAICNDPFEIFWYAEKEEWHFKDAVRVENKLYHPICFEDATSEENTNNSGALSSTAMVLDETETIEKSQEPAGVESMDVNHGLLVEDTNSSLVKAEPV